MFGPVCCSYRLMVSYYIFCIVLLPKGDHQLCSAEQPQADGSLLQMYSLTSTETFSSYKSVDHDGSCF